MYFSANFAVFAHQSNAIANALHVGAFITTVVSSSSKTQARVTHATAETAVSLALLPP